MLILISLLLLFSSLMLMFTSMLTYIGIVRDSGESLCYVFGFWVFLDLSALMYCKDSPGCRGHLVFLGKTPNSQRASLHPGV